MINTPALFLAHGSPMNVIADNEITRAFQLLGKRLEKPKSILMISAHWETNGTAISVKEHPETIYDFYGFPKELYQIKYPAPGAVEVAYQVQTIVKSGPIFLDLEMGFDHGTWTVLKHVFPNADIPVTQLSLDVNKSLADHYHLAKEISILRQQGVMIIGSGNIVHNLRMANFGNPSAKPFQWAVDFDEFIKSAVSTFHHQALLDNQQYPEYTNMAVPTAEHFLPLLYILGTQQLSDRAVFFHNGFEHGSISQSSLILES